MRDLRGMGMYPLASHAEGAPRLWLPEFVQALDGIIANDERPISAAWASSLRQSRLYEPQFLDVLDRFHSHNPDATASEMQRRLLSAEQDTIFAAQTDGAWPFAPYPSERYADPRMWGRSYAFIQRNPAYWERYKHDVLWRSLGTTIPQRTVVMRFLNQVLPHLVGEDPVWANCGSGDMTPDKLALLSRPDGEFMYDPVVVQERALGGLVVSAYKSDIFNSLVGERTTIRRIVGLDRVDPKLLDSRAWSRACSSPEELLQGRLDELHARLLRVDLPPGQLAFRIADLTMRDSVREVVKETGRFSAAAAIFSWFHGTAGERSKKLHNMRHELIARRRQEGRDGIVLIVDHARPVNGNRHLMPDRVWRTPTVFIGYQGVLHEVLKGGTGRFGAVRVLPALIGLAKRGPYDKQVRDLAGAP